MKFDPTERYQDPGFMLDALDAAVETLESGVDLEEEERLMTAALQDPAKKEQQTAVMVVEANTNLQDAFRESFTNAGFRTLVVSNCERVEWLDDGEAFSVDAALSTLSRWARGGQDFNSRNCTRRRTYPPSCFSTKTGRAAYARRGKETIRCRYAHYDGRLIMVVKKLVAQEAARRSCARPCAQGRKARKARNA